MPKLPWFKFNPSWWMGDAELSKCSSATRGVWIDLLCAMHQSGRSGELRGTTDQIARLARCSTAELTQALTELQTTGTADVTFRNNDVTVVNRLMKREAKARTATALRVKKHRSNDDVTQKKQGRSKKIEVRKERIQGARQGQEKATFTANRLSLLYNRYRRRFSEMVAPLNRRNDFSKSTKPLGGT
jgi:hypothetical protein